MPFPVLMLLATTDHAGVVRRDPQEWPGEPPHAEVDLMQGQERPLCPGELPVPRRA